MRNLHDYLNAISAGVVEHDSFFKQFAESIPFSKNEIEVSQRLFGKRKERNRRLNWFIDYAYKYNINLKEPRFQQLHDGEPYFVWLMNLADFDYSNFNPYWLLEFTTDSYIEEYKKHPKIVNALIKAVKDNPIHGFLNFYCKYFLNLPGESR